MKPLIWIIIAAATAALAEPTAVRAQQPTPLETEAAKDRTKALEEKAKALEAKTKALDEQRWSEEQEEKADAGADTAPRPPAMPGKHWVGAGGFGGAGAPAVNAFGQDRLQPILTRGAGAAGKPLVIRSSTQEPKEEANLEEDLAVMAHIFDKSLEDLPGGQPHAFKAAGIDVVFTPAQSPMRCLYLDGYGAVFLLNVSFPLVPPPQKVEKEKPAVDSAWAEAQEELFGQPGEGHFVAGTAEEYSEEKVNHLKDLLYDTLKNATNIRGLKTDDWVTVAVFGGSSSVRAKAKAAAKRTWVAKDGDMLLWHDSEGPGRQTMLTVRVKKVDVDAYAKGKMNAEEFQKRAKLTAYNSGAGPGMFGGEVGIGYSGVVGARKF
jgi:hypothetical protein